MLIQMIRNLTLVVAEVLLMQFVANAQFTTIINVPPDTVPNHIGSDTQINLLDNGVIGYMSVGATDGTYTNIEVNMLGGTLEQLGAYAGSIVNVSGGILDTFGGNANSVLNVSGGNIIGVLSSYGGQLNVQGGSIEDSSYVILDNTWVEMSGGLLLGELNAVDSQINLSDGAMSGIVNTSNTNFNVSGGSIGDSFTSFNSTFDMSGGAIGDNAYMNITRFNMSNGSIGKNAYMSDAKFSLSNGVIGQNFTIGNDFYSNNEVTISGGMIGDGFTVNPHSEVNLLGGSIGHDMTVVGSQSRLVLRDGTIGDRLQTKHVSIRMIDGSIGDNFTMDGGYISMSGGAIGDNFTGRSLIMISGGTIGHNFSTDSHIANVHLAGGNTQEDFFQSPLGLNLRIYGTEFIADGVDITETLAMNQETPISIPISSLSGHLADGESFNFLMPSLGSFSPSVPRASHEAPASTLTLIRIEPGNFEIVNQGFYPGIPRLDVDGADFLRWQRGLANYLAPDDLANWELNFGHLSDFDGDGDTDGADFLEWQRGLTQPYYMNNRLDWEANFGSPPSPTAAAIVFVPEPSTALLFLVGLVVTSVRCMHRQT